MYTVKQCVTTLHANKMLRLFRTCNTKGRLVSKALIFNSADQYKSCVQLTAKCHYSSNATDTSRENTQVYYGTLTPQIRLVKLFSLITSVGGLASQPILIQQAPNLGTPVVVALFGFMGFFTLVTPFLLHMMTKKYVTHIYFNPVTGNYSAVRLNFFLVEKKITFTADDVVVPDVPGIFTSFEVKGLPLFVDPTLFEGREHYAKIMGYDKPIDFKLNIPPEKSNSVGKKDAE